MESYIGHPVHHLSNQIEAWLADSANNAVEPGSTLPAFAKPLVGCAQGEDQLFDFLKIDIRKK